MTTSTTDQPVQSYKYYDEKGQHLHTLDAKPLRGTSGISKVVGSIPGWWASGLAVKVFGVTDPKLLTKIKNKTITTKELAELRASVEKKHEEIKQMDSKQFLMLCDAAYRAHQQSLEESADAGTDLHAELERFVRDRIEGFDIDKPVKAYPAKIKPFIEWYLENVDKPLWSEMHCYSRKHWVGGISDFGFLDKKGQVGIMDFKSAKVARPQHFWQCGGYDLQISENGGYRADGTKIFDLPRPVDYYAVLPFGAEKVVPVLEYDVEGCKQAFLACLFLYEKLPQNNG